MLCSGDRKSMLLQFNCTLSEFVVQKCDSSSNTAETVHKPTARYHYNNNYYYYYCLQYTHDDGYCPQPSKVDDVQPTLKNFQRPCMKNPTPEPSQPLHPSTMRCTAVSVHGELCDWHRRFALVQVQQQSCSTCHCPPNSRRPGAIPFATALPFVALSGVQLVLALVVACDRIFGKPNSKKEKTKHEKTKKSVNWV